MLATFNKTDDILPTTQLHIATLNVNGIHNEKQNQWTTNNLKSRYYFLAKNTLNTWNCSEMEERMERKIPLGLQNHFRSISGCNTLQRTFWYRNYKFAQKSRWTGDFNMISNIFCDRKGGNPSIIHTIGIQTLNHIKSQHNLIDIWWKTNPYKRYFTYRTADSIIHSRLDWSYMTKTSKTKKMRYTPNIQIWPRQCFCLNPDQ